MFLDCQNLFLAFVFVAGNVKFSFLFHVKFIFIIEGEDFYVGYNVVFSPPTGY